MHLESDAFTITYDPDEVGVDVVLAKIRSLGYAPRVVDAVKPAAGGGSTGTSPLPELVATALAAAAEDGKLLFVDFYAAWCAPCKVLEEHVFTREDVEHALEGYRLLKVDTDRHPKVAEYFKIKALPTLVVLDKQAVTRYRHVGMIAVDELIRELKLASKPSGRHGGP